MAGLSRSVSSGLVGPIAAIRCVIAHHHHQVISTAQVITYTALERLPTHDLIKNRPISLINAYS